MPLTPTQQSLLENWLKKHPQPIDPRRPKAPDELIIGETLEPIQLTPSQKSLLENWLNIRREPADLRERKSSAGQRKGQNPKWTNDTGFERRYGDPDYYNRVKGLD